MLHEWHGAGQSVIVVTLGWTAMMSVMMAPTVAPWIRTYHRFVVGEQREWSRLSATAVFAGGYLAVWTCFGLVIALAQPFISMPAGSGSLLLIAAGLYQLSPLKQACLMHCRNPFSFLLARWKDGPRPAFRLGVQHGIYCLGCCWALMLTAFAAGVMSLWWMAALTLLTFIEQVSRVGARLRVPIGGALIAAGLALWAS